ncbi:MAG: hypothetical protein RI885_2301 [Actinomycetota bacterium]|jgi:hypothetical protein
MRTLNAYLSRKLQAIFPDALVYEDQQDGRTSFVLERRGVEPESLGSTFQEAKASVDVLRRAHKGTDHA